MFVVILQLFINNIVWIRWHAEITMCCAAFATKIACHSRLVASFLGFEKAICVIFRRHLPASTRFSVTAASDSISHVGATPKCLFPNILNFTYT